MEKNRTSNNANSKTSIGYHDGEVETVISVEDVNRQAQQIAEKVSMEKISGLVNGEPFLKIENLNAGYGKMEILHDFNLQVGKGQSLCMIGPNGAGKTTLLKLLMREIYPLWRSHPVVRILGKERNDIWDLRRQLGIISADLQENYSSEVLGRQVVLSGFFSSVGVWGHHRLTDEQHERVDGRCCQSRRRLFRCRSHRLHGP